MAYCNRKQREILGFLAGYGQLLEDWVNEGSTSYMHRTPDELNHLLDECKDIIQAMLTDISIEQRNRIQRQLDNQRVTLVYKESPVLTKEWALIESDVLRELVQNPFCECFMCDKQGKEAKNCPRRKLLFRAMMTPTNSEDTGDCPWRMA